MAWSSVGRFSRQGGEDMFDSMQDNWASREHTTGVLTKNSWFAGKNRGILDSGDE